MIMLITKRYHYQKLAICLILSFILSFFIYSINSEFDIVQRESLQYETYNAKLTSGYMVIEPPFYYSSISSSSSEKYAQTTEFKVFSDEIIDQLINYPYIDYVDVNHVNKFFVTRPVIDDNRFLQHKYFTSLNIELIDGNVPDDYSNEIVLKEGVCSDCEIGDEYQGYKISGFYSSDTYSNIDYIKAYNGTVSDEYLEFLDFVESDNELGTTNGALLIKYDPNFEVETFNFIDSLISESFIYTPNYDQELIGFRFSMITDFTMIVFVILILLTCVFILYLKFILKAGNKKLLMYGYEKSEIMSIVTKELIVMFIVVLIFNIIWAKLLFSGQNILIVLLISSIFLSMFVSLIVLGVKIDTRK